MKPSDLLIQLGIRFRKLSQVIKKSSNMSQSLRYFPNPKLDYEASFGAPKIEENSVMEYTNQLLREIEENFPPTDKNGGI